MFNFEKSKDYLICIDSDGCVMDTMTIKHTKAFGPEVINTFNLNDKKEKILTYWNELNLFSKNRGINRFKALSMTFSYLKEEMNFEIKGTEDFKKWCEETKSLSNEALIQEIVKTNNNFFRKILQWSNNVNESINMLPKVDCVYEGVRETLNYVKDYADIVVVSSANKDALNEEWSNWDCKKYVKQLLDQDFGTKTICIENLIKYGYKKDKIIMIGDAFGDLEAANNNGVLFYPILVGKEKYSWDRFKRYAFSKFLNGNYDDIYQQKFLNEMKEILK